MRKLDEDFFQLGTLIESLPPRIERCTNICIKATSDQQVEDIQKEMELVISHRLEATQKLRQLIDRIKENDLEKYCPVVGTVGRALHGEVDLLLLEHGELFIAAVEAVVPEPSSHLSEKIFHEILAIKNETLDAALARYARVRRIKLLREIDEEDEEEDY